MTADRRPQRDPRHPDEHFEPYELDASIPWPLLGIAVALGVWGAATLFDTRRHEERAQVERIEDTRLATGQAVEPGHALFEASCATCHQSNGLGIRRAVPPLAGSPFVQHGPELVANIMLRGIDGPIRVNDALYDGHMPSFASVFTDVEVAELASYVAARWGENDRVLEAAEAAELRGRVSDLGSFRGGAGVAEDTGLALGDQPPFASGTLQPVAPEISALIFEGRGGQWSCASCHGDLGQGRENTPRLAGLPADYIRKQLHDFAAGRRLNESMAVVVAELTDEEKQALGAYYSGLRVPSNARPDLGGDLERGEQLAREGDWSLTVPSCFSCHGPSGFGVAPEFPPLAAQHAAYTASQLAAWAGGQRTNSSLDLMEHISSALSAADRRSVADYLASLPPVPVGTGDTLAAQGEDR